MKDSITEKLSALSARHEELARLLSEPDVIAAQDRFRDLAREYAQLEPTIEHYRRHCDILTQLVAAQEMAQDSDAEMRALAHEEVAALKADRDVVERELQTLLLPRDPKDDHNVFLEVRAGTGGDEAAIFAGDLLRMYTRYAERVGWQAELLSERGGRTRRL